MVNPVLQGKNLAIRAAEITHLTNDRRSNLVMSTPALKSPLRPAVVKARGKRTVAKSCLVGGAGNTECTKFFSPLRLQLVSISKWSTILLSPGPDSGAKRGVRQVDRGNSVNFEDPDLARNNSVHA
jgi:hypothetical protein